LGILLRVGEEVTREPHKLKITSANPVPAI
jgi:hypothetical protein